MTMTMDGEQIKQRRKSPTDFKWTDASGKLACKLFAEGLTYTEIAEKIGGGCTRAMVRGKVRRMKLEQPKRIHPVVLEVATQPMPELPAVEAPNEHSCTIDGLNNYTCRYPLWDLQAPESERFYCGRPANYAAARPYCDHHMERCVTPVPPRTRR